MPLLLALVIALFIPAASFAQATAPLTPEQTLGVRQISDLELSPDGTRLAFVVTEPPKGAQRPHDIWMLDLRTRDVRRMTYSTKGANSPRWSPDGRVLAFLSDRDGGTQIHLLPMAGGEASPFTEGKSPVRAFEWSPDGTRIAYLATEPRSEAEEKREKDRDDARVVDKDDRPSRLWVIDRETKTVHQLTTGRWTVREAHWMPDGDQLVVVATDRPEVEQSTDRIFTLARTGGDLVPMAAPRGPFSRVRVRPDGKAIAWVGSRVDGPSPHDLFELDTGSAAPRNLTGQDVDRPVTAFGWRSDRTLVASVSDGFRCRLVSISTAGQPAVQPDLTMNGSGFTVAPSGDVLFVGETAVDAPEVWRLSGSAQPERLTRLNAGWQRPEPIRPEFFTYRSFDGLEIEAALLLPRAAGGSARATAARRLPLVTLIHGGPTGRWADTFEPWGQLLAARGYAVFYPNIRGSVGYGHRFIEANRADWGGADFKDVMAGIDALIARGVADPGRLGIGGWSYGGYMSEWAITQTTRFKAAVVGAGLSDLASEFGTEAGPEYDEWFFGTPYEKLAGFVEHSPITYIKNAKTPSLILQGEADTTDPIGQSQELYRGLKRYGVEADLVLYPREGHGLREEKHLLDRLNRIVAWYDKYVKGGTRP